jgi:murein peptide amidase A
VRHLHRLALCLCLALTSCARDRAWSPLDSDAPSDVTSRSAWRTIDRSVEHRPIEAVTTGHGPFRLLLIAGIHGNEREGATTPAPLLEHLADTALQRAATVIIVRDLNPDGSARRSRRNARSVDLNRNWPSSNFTPSRDHGPAPLSEPETAALAREIDRFDPDLVVIFHSTRSGPFVDSDGPSERDADAFVGAARSIDPRWRHQPDFTNPPGSLGTHLGLDQTRPVLTVEFKRNQSQSLAAQASIAGIEAIITRRAHP